jgi:hypothetical protein
MPLYPALLANVLGRALGKALRARSSAFFEGERGPEELNKCGESCDGMEGRIFETASLRGGRRINPVRFLPRTPDAFVGGFENTVRPERVDMGMLWSMVYYTIKVRDVINQIEKSCISKHDRIALNRVVGKTETNCELAVETASNCAALLSVHRNVPRRERASDRYTRDA